MKKSNYLGKVYPVPDWTKFIAADNDGNVVAYSESPSRGSYGFLRNTGQSLHIGFIGQASYPQTEVK